MWRILGKTDLHLGSTVIIPVDNCCGQPAGSFDPSAENRDRIDPIPQPTPGSSAPCPQGRAQVVHRVFHSYVRWTTDSEKQRTSDETRRLSSILRDKSTDLIPLSWRFIPRAMGSPGCGAQHFPQAKIAQQEALRQRIAQAGLPSEFSAGGSAQRTLRFCSISRILYDKSGFSADSRFTLR